MAKLSYLPFYASQWLSDQQIRSLSFAARGLCTDMLCLMHLNDRRVYLQLNGQPVSAAHIARMTGGAPDEVHRLLQELENSGVFSVDAQGIMYSRRMVRDERKRALCREAGKLGGNPTLKGGSKGHPKGHAKGPPYISLSSPPLDEDLPKNEERDCTQLEGGPGGERTLKGHPKGQPTPTGFHPHDCDGTTARVELEMGAIRVEAGGASVALSRLERGWLSDLLEERTPDEVLNAWRWLLTSPHERAEFRRRGKWATPKLFLDPKNFGEIFDLSRGPDAWAAPTVAPRNERERLAARSKAAHCFDAKREESEDVQF